MDPSDDIWLEPDPVWTDRYETRRERIEAVAGDGLLGVFHVGSTAIPDVPGKPALDVVAVYEDGDALRGAVERLTAEATDGDYEAETVGDDAALVVQWPDDYGVFLKLHTPDDEKVRNQLIFRDYLRDTAEARREYEAVKREAARTHGGDHGRYTEAKSEVVSSLLVDAREAGYDDDLPEFV
jgi:GrpB-like predicted nucleotidyltransferase (UPF0157 family)